MERAETVSPEFTVALAEMLRVLRTGWQPPSELSKLLGCTQSEAHHRIETLRDAGFDIPLHPLRGYRLEGGSHTLSAADILSRQQHPWPPRIEVIRSTTSTNSLALEHGARGGPTPVVFFAEEQTGGKGRFGRIWHSEPGKGLWMSLCLNPEGALPHWPRLTTLAALAIAQTVESLTGMAPQIKWPNDLILSGRKVSGVLAESAHRADGTAFLVLGIGINVNQSSFPKDLIDTAGSLHTISGKLWDRNAIAADLLLRLKESFHTMDSQFEHALEEVRKRSSVLGKKVTVHTGSEQIEGVAEDLGGEGDLILRTPNGEVRRFAAGEVSLKSTMPANK